MGQDVTRREVIRAIGGALMVLSPASGGIDKLLNHSSVTGGDISEREVSGAGNDPNYWSNLPRLEMEIDSGLRGYITIKAYQAPWNDGKFFDDLHELRTDLWQSGLILPYIHITESTPSIQNGNSFSIVAVGGKVIKGIEKPYDYTISHELQRADNMLSSLRQAAVPYNQIQSMKN